MLCYVVLCCVSVRVGAQRRLFHPMSLISDSSSNETGGLYARGHNLHSSTGDASKLMSKTLEQIRRLSDYCSGMQGFIITHGSGGGTGSGFLAALMERLSVEYPKKSKFGISVMSGAGNSDAANGSGHHTGSVIDPYNAVLSVHSANLEHFDTTLVIENSAVYDRCYQNLEIERPRFTDMNRLIAYAISCATGSMRFESSLCVDLSEFRTALVPYPRLQFIWSALSPLINSEHRLSRYFWPDADLVYPLWEVPVITKYTKYAGPDDATPPYSDYKTSASAYRRAESDRMNSGTGSGTGVSATEPKQIEPPHPHPQPVLRTAAECKAFEELRHFSHSMVDGSLHDGKYMALCMLYRGDFAPAVSACLLVCGCSLRTGCMTAW